jgi:hypothetical protein
MQSSETINELAAALSKAQGEITGAAKDSKNPFFNSAYADLSSVKEAMQAPFTKYGLSVVQFPKTDYSGTPEAYEWTAKRSGETRYGVRVFCVVSVVTRLMHSSGQWLEDSVSTMLPNGDPQAVGSAITYMRRYALASVAGVAPEDDDAEAAHTGNRQQQAAAARPVGVPAPPAGFATWLDDLRAVVDEGTVRLQAVWKESPIAFRQYLTATNAAGWERMKAAAEAKSNAVSA